MGGASSALNCSSGKKKKKKKTQENGTKKRLSDEVDAYTSKVEELRTDQASEVTKRVSAKDKELVDDQLKEAEKKYNEVQSKTEKLRRSYSVLGVDLIEIQDSVKNYLAWLKEKDDVIVNVQPQGYLVKDSETGLQTINDACTEMENKQLTLDTVNQKVETLSPDLTRNDRDGLKQLMKTVSQEHHWVYDKALACRNKMEEAVQAREVFNTGLERVQQWLQDQEKKLSAMDKVRLQSTEVDKQAEKVKTFQTEVNNYKPNMDQLQVRVEALIQDCNPEQKAELENKLQDVANRYKNLKTQIQDVHNHLRDTAAARKVYETDVQKVDRWCKETEMKCAVEPSLDCAKEILQEQCKQYKTLNNTAKMFDSLVKEIEERGQTFLPNLHESDTFPLQHQLRTTQDKFDRVNTVIQERLKSLEDMLHTRSQIGDEIQETADWLEAVQGEVRKVPRAIGHSVEDAEQTLKQYEAIGEKISNYQPTVAQLNQAVERLRGLGQNTEADEILRLTSQYEMLGDQVAQQCKKSQQAVLSRQQFQDQLKEVETLVKDCEDQVDAMIGGGVAIPAKIEKLKETSAKLQTTAPYIFHLGDRAQQIGIEGTGEDAQAVNEKVQEVKARMDNLKKLADRKAKQCEMIQRNREDFEETVDETINWLDQKEDVLASCGSLDLDPQKVNSVLLKHQALSRDALDKLDTVKMKAQVEKAHFEELEEPIPAVLAEKLEQVGSLEDSIKGAIAKKEQYLAEAKADRIQLELSMRQITDWIQGAEDLLDSGYEGMDYDTLNDTLSEHKDYFSEASMCQDELEQVMELSERLLPTLDVNDKETLRQSLKNTNQKLANIVAASQRKQQSLENKMEDWRDYQDTVMQVTQDLHGLEHDWMSLDSQLLASSDKIQEHLKTTRDFINKVEDFRPAINDLNEKARDLDKEASGGSRAMIDQLTANINARWDCLVEQTENKQMNLQDLEAQYEDYITLLSSVEQNLAEAEAILPQTIDVDSADSPVLLATLQQTRKLHSILEVVEPKLTALKKCGKQLQKNLPSAEAKVHTQESMMAALEKFERIHDKGKETHQAVQEELDEREGFTTEARQTLEWLTETKAELQQLPPTMEVPEVMEKMEKIRLSEQEIAVRMGQMRHLAQLQETKYTSQGRELPQELMVQIQQMSALEAEVADTMRTKEEELLHLKEDRMEYEKILQLTNTWLSQANQQLQERILNIPESQYRHEDLTGEFDDFKKNLDKLRNRGGDIIKHSSDPIEKQTVQKVLADKNRQWLTLQAKAAEHTKQLHEAQELSDTFTNAANAVEYWAEQAESVLQAEPTWADFDRVREQLKVHRRLQKEVDQQQAKLKNLNAIVKQMEPLCDAAPAMEKLGSLSRRVFDIRTKTTDKVNDLEEVNEQIEDYEQQIAELRQWMDKTRSHLTMRDTTVALKDQIALQDKLIEDIESHKGRAMFVLQKHAELHQAAGEEAPAQSKRLASEISNLLTMARDQKDDLKQALLQQEQYEMELSHLTAAISEKQDRLLSSPVHADNVEELKQQITEHNELAKEIKAYQSRVQELSEKSHDLAERTADLGPLLARKLYHGDPNLTVADLDKILKTPLEYKRMSTPASVTPASSFKTLSGKSPLSTPRTLVSESPWTSRSTLGPGSQETSRKSPETVPSLQMDSGMYHQIDSGVYFSPASSMSSTQRAENDTAQMEPKMFDGSPAAKRPHMEPESGIHPGKYRVPSSETIHRVGHESDGKTGGKYKPGFKGKDDESPVVKKEDIMDFTKMFDRQAVPSGSGSESLFKPKYAKTQEMGKPLDSASRSQPMKYEHFKPVKTDSDKKAMKDGGLSQKFTLSRSRSPSPSLDLSKSLDSQMLRHEQNQAPPSGLLAPHGPDSGRLSPSDHLHRKTLSLSPRTLDQSSSHPSLHVSNFDAEKQNYIPPQMKSLSAKKDKPLSASLRPDASSKDTLHLDAGPAFMDVSRSVPSLLDPYLSELRERSSSFGSRVQASGDGLPHHLRGSSRFADLSSSWQNLQQQIGVKERELQVALQKQERYQQIVQDVMSRMERAQHRLSGMTPDPHKDLNQQMRELRDVEQEIESIREEIARVKERGRQVMETADPEGYQAMQSTLNMLTDKIESLQAMADDKARQLQNAMKNREKHDIDLSAYKKHIRELENWVEEMTVRQATTPLPTDSVATLQQQLQENRDLQEELNQRLQLVADLAVQCDSLCDLEPSATAEKLRSQLATLQQNMGNLKLAAIEKQAPLRSTIKESEKRRREMDDYESNVKRLQQWISDTKKLATGPTMMEPMITPAEKQELQHQLESDLSQHRLLVRQLSSEMKTRDVKPPREVITQALPPVSEDDLKQNWETLSKDLATKKQNLQDLLQKAGELVAPAQYGRLYPPHASETTAQLYDVRRHLAELGDLWKQLQGQVEDRQLRLDQAFEFQQKYQTALQNVSAWLDLAEQKVMTPDTSLNSEEKVKENEDMQREIKSLQSEIASMSQAAQELMAVANADTHDLIRQSLANLNDRVKLLENQAQDQGEKLRVVDKQYRLYQDEVRSLEEKLAEIRQLMKTPSPTAPLNQVLTNVQRIETQLKKCESQLEELKNRQAELSALDPEIVSPQEIDVLQSNYMDLQRKVMERKEGLLQSVSVQEQYEKLLMDYADFLDTADDKLKTEQISAKDLDHLRHQLNAHKDFFSDMEVHRAMLDSLAAQCDKATKQKHLPTHTRLNNLTYVLQDKASLHGQRLDRLVRQWGEMDEKFNQLQRFLDDIDQNMPKPISSEDSISTIQSKISMYQRLQGELNNEKPTVFQVVDKGKQLLHSINCPSLETLITELADKWVDLNTDLSHELKKTQSLGDQLQVFESEAGELRSWLTNARMKLSGIKQLSDTDMKSIAAVRSKIDKLLEFRKEVENQQKMKENVLATGNQLSENKIYQTADLKSRMKFFEEEWALLEHDITNAEEYLHQAQMDLMPSRQALGELNGWLNEIEKNLKEDRVKTIRGLADMEVLLKKYKAYKIDLSSKQLTVDFVNQDVLQPKDDAEAPAPAERNEFHERLGTLNTRWQEVSRHVSERLKNLESLHSKWEEYEKALGKLISWFREQEDKLKKYRLIGHEVNVRQTLKDCKLLKQTLKGKEAEIDAVKELGETLVQLSYDAPSCQQSVQASLRDLNLQWRHLDDQIDQVQKLLQDILSQWDCYHTELQALSQTLAETEYCLQRYTLIGGDIATLKIQVEKLEGLMSDMERHAVRHEKFVALATRLNQVCDVPVRQEIQKTQVDINTRWQKVFGELRDRLDRFRDCLQQWLMYEDDYSRARMWLDSKEKLCDELVYTKEDKSRRDENLEKSKTLQRDLDNFQTQLSNLYRVSDEVTKNMDPSSIVSITSRLSGLDQRLMALRQKLAKHIQSLQGDLSQQRKFQEAFTAMKTFLSQAERTLGTDDPGKAAEEKVLRERLDHLKELSSKFNIKSAQLDSLNDLGYRLALNETAAVELQDLNHKWHKLYSETKERCKTLQGILLVQQDFTEKCETWMTFLAQTENDLATEIAGNLVDLQDQQRRCEKFDSEMYSRQQILHAIISDGQKMMKDGDVEDMEQFQQKLHLLADQWQSVFRRANQRKAIIDNSIKQWLAFNDMTEKLRDWLADKEDGLQAYEFDKASLQKIKNLVAKAKHTQNEFKLQEDLFKKMNDQGKQLLQRADANAQEELKVSMAQVQQHWHQIFVKLDEHRTKLEDILKKWGECEEDIEEILAWLKETRKTLGADLPTSYDELQADLNRCKDIETSFANSEDKRQMLLAKERVVADVIEPEDLNVLHQRIRLLNKQWDELRNQADLRSQRIKDTMFRWSNFNDRIRDMYDWIDKMEVKVISTKDYHIEDLLNRLQKDFREEIMEKEKTKTELETQGRHLMKVSSEVRASDIEQKLARMDDKWKHLKAMLGFRQRKLQETLLAVQQLDVSMGNLRKWLADREHELSAPVIYQESERLEIQRKLRHQQDVQEDIERHSPGVGSVLNLCEVLLHDSDACPTQIEFNALQTAMKNLDRRWRNICQMSPDQRSRVEETWRLWQTFTEDCRKFCDWLAQVEVEVSDVTLEQLDISISKEEYKKCEALQRRIHERLANLEDINKQYRRLAREGRTDISGALKSMMQEANDRWDKLQSEMATIMRQLKHSSSIREDFTQTRESLLSWLTEIDMQLTNIEHLSSMDVPTKLREVRRMQEEIDSRAKKFDYLDEAGLYLIQKGDANDSFTVQDELDEFNQYYKQVIDRVALYQARLERMVAAQIKSIAKLGKQPGHLADDIDRLEDELYADYPGGKYSMDWDMKEIEAYLEASPPESPPEKRRAVLRARARSRSKSPTRRSRSPRPISPRGRSPRRVVADYVDAVKQPTRDERWHKIQGELRQRGQEAKVEELLERLVDALEDAAEKLTKAENELRSHTPTGPRVEQRSDTYMQCMSDCERAVDNVRRIERLLKTETGLHNIASADAQVQNVIERWEMLQASAIEKDFRLRQQRQDWGQFRADLDNMLMWLDEAEALQHTHKPLPGEITRLDTIIRQHKDFLVQLESKKARVLSINLISRSIVDTTTEEGRQLRDKLKTMNKRWDAICERATQLQKDLQIALIQCQEFHHTIHDLLLWLENIETKLQQCEPVNLGADDAALWQKRKKLVDIKFDLEKNQPRVMSLRDTADQLLMNSDSPEMSNAKDKMHIIANRLKALLRLCSSYITSLDGRLEGSKSSGASISLDMSGSAGSSGASSPRDWRTSTPRYSPANSLRTRARSPFAVSRQLNRSS